MSIPIGDTPALTDEEAVAFMFMIHEGLKHPVGLTPTPKLDEARKLIQYYANRRKDEIIQNN